MRGHSVTRRTLVAGGGIVLAARSAFASDYNPAARGSVSRAADIVLDVVVNDAARGRHIPVLIRLQSRRERMPIVLFSHGLGGSRHGSEYLMRHWVNRGYVTVFLQHPGSDEALWRDVPPARRWEALAEAASVGNAIARIQDVAAVLDALTAWQTSRDRDYPGDRLDLTRIGMSGHSFGAITTQAVAGQTVPKGVPGTWPDPRIRAALLMSPSVPPLMPVSQAFANVAIPWLIMTGTHDTSPINPTSAEGRLAVFQALPPGSKYELVLNGAEHSAFGERALPFDLLPRNPNHPRAILAISAAFWDAHLAGRADARAWLDGDGPRSVLEPGDRWQRK
jgi:predicted dienelactone hydrolase